METGFLEVLSFPTHRHQAQQPKHAIPSLLPAGTHVEALLSFSSPFLSFLHETC